MKINTNAFTLIEIILASLIFGVVVVGVVTSNMALQKNSKNSADTYYVVQNTNKSINRILLDASLMAGTTGTTGTMGTTGDPGFAGASGFAGSNSDGMPMVIGQDYFQNKIYAPNTGDPNTFCFYQGQVSVTLYSPTYAYTKQFMVGPEYVPIPSNSSRPWVCYTLNTSTHEIHRCSRHGNENPPIVGSPIQPCTGGETLGNAKKITTTFSLNNPSSDNQKAVFSIILENCPDPANAQCSPGTNYPYIIKSGSVTPNPQSAG